MAHTLIFLGTPEFAEHHLRKLSNDSRYKILAVVSQPDRPSGRKMQLQPSPVKKLAQELGLKVFTPEKAKDPQFLADLKTLNAEAAVVVAYGQILSEAFLDIFPKKVVNVHGSLLPRWRGAAPIQRAIMSGDTETGVSLQVMVKALDAGDVIAEAKTNIAADESALQLHDRLKELGSTLLADSLTDYLKGQIKPWAQDESQVTYAKKIEKAEANVDWTRSAKDIYNHFRGMALGPGIRSKLGGSAYKLTGIKVGSQNAQAGVPGEILEVTEDYLVVQCGLGTLEIYEIQPDSRSRMRVNEFLRGHELKEGNRFE